MQKKTPSEVEIGEKACLSFCGQKSLLYSLHILSSSIMYMMICVCASETCVRMPDFHAAPSFRVREVLYEILCPVKSKWNCACFETCLLLPFRYALAKIGEYDNRHIHTIKYNLLLVYHPTWISVNHSLRKKFSKINTFPAIITCGPILIIYINQKLQTTNSFCMKSESFHFISFIRICHVVKCGIDFDSYFFFTRLCNFSLSPFFLHIIFFFQSRW